MLFTNKPFSGNPAAVCVMDKWPSEESMMKLAMIFFFTDHISHVAYGKFVAIARERKIPFSYLHGVNMEQIIRQIYESGK